MYEIFCKYSYDYYFPHTSDYYFPHTSDYYFPHTIKEVFKEVFKEYTTRARPTFYIRRNKKRSIFYLYTSLLCPISNISIVKISSWISANNL